MTKPEKFEIICKSIEGDIIEFPSYIDPVDKVVYKEGCRDYDIQLIFLNAFNNHAKAIKELQEKIKELKNMIKEIENNLHGE